MTGLIHLNGQLSVKFLLKVLHLEEYFLDPTVISADQFTTLCLIKIKNTFVEQWKMSITALTSNNGQLRKLRFYSQIKTTFEREPYIDNVNNFFIHKNLAKFRCSDNKFEIESGRDKKVNANERICKLYNAGIENEMHFLALCPLYKPLRDQYFRNIPENEYKNLLKCSDMSTESFHVNSGHVTTYLKLF